MALPYFFGEVPEHKAWYVKAKYKSWSSQGTISNWQIGGETQEILIQHLKDSAIKFGHIIDEFDYLEIKPIEKRVAR